MIVLLVVILVQTVVQTLVGNRLTSERLQLHPLSSIISSVCGVAIAGVVGAILSAPALALGMAVSRRTRAMRRLDGAAAEPTDRPGDGSSASRRSTLQRGDRCGEP
jgi:predicted PurR-regulated permease PerM